MEKALTKQHSNRLWMRCFLTLVFLLMASYAFSEEVQVTASAPRLVKVGEQFRFVISVNAKPSSYSPAPLNDFQVMSGPSVSSSSSVQIINGKVTQSANYSYTFILQATKEGKFTIDPFSMKVGNETYQSNPITIEVVKGGGSQQQNQQNQQNNNQQQNQQVQDFSNEDLFVRVIISDKDVYRGEHLIATVKIYSKVNLAGINNMKNPDFSGFYQQEIETPPLTSLEREQVNGEIYGTGVLQRMILFPQRSGKITIDPIEMECIVRKAVRRAPRSFFDDFFSQGYQDYQVKIKSSPVTINVKDFPAGKPSSFNGAVGILDFKTEIDKTEVKSNDAINLKITVVGSGNIKLVEAPTINFPPDFEVYDPEVNLNLKNTTAGQSGSKTFQYLIIPRYAGDFTIPPVEFSYFDLKSKTYKTLSSQEYKIHVEKGAGDQGGGVQTFEKEELKFLGKDVHFIKTDVPVLKPFGNVFYNSVWFYLLYLVAILMFVVLVMLKRKQVRLAADNMLLKNKKANNQAKKRLKKAGVFLSQNRPEQFYEEISNALWGYLSEKLLIPLAELSKEKAVARLTGLKVDPEKIQELFNVIEQCEYARYAPPSGENPMQQIFGQAESVLLGLINILKK